MKVVIKGNKMLYLLVAFTFLLSIVFYGFYPRSDALKMMDKPQADLPVTELLVQHNALVQAGEIVQKEEDSDVQKLAYEFWSGTTTFPSTATQFLPTGYNLNTNVQWKLFCIDNKTGVPQTNLCGRRAPDTNITRTSPLTDAPYGSTDFLVSYITSDNIASEFGNYIESLTPNALGEKFFMLEYKKDLHPKTACGLLTVDTVAAADLPLFAPLSNSGYVLSNGRTPIVSVPQAIIDELPSSAKTHGALLCLTRVSAAQPINCYEDKTENDCKISVGCEWTDFGTANKICRPHVINIRESQDK